jgi:hypothetical protein
VVLIVVDRTETSPVTPPTPVKPLFPYTPGDEMSPEANRRAIIALQNAKDYTIEGDSQEGQTLFDKLIIEEPDEFRNKSFMDHLQDIQFNESLITEKIEEYFYTSLHLTFCRKRDDSLAIVSPNQVLFSVNLKFSFVEGKYNHLSQLHGLFRRPKSPLQS